MPDTKEITTRKLHSCSVCEGDIFPGTLVMCTVPRDRNESFWTHLECFEEEEANA